MWYEDLFCTLKNAADKQKAIEMSAYMRNMFPFLGIPTPMRRKICQPFFKAAKQEKSVDFQFTDQCWDKPEREFQYVAKDYLVMMQNYLTESDVEKIKEYIISKSWWDITDGLDQVVGHMAESYPNINQTLLAWSVGDNIWLRRTAIDHQLSRKERTDQSLLAKIIVNNLNSDEFFINKAIGWSLRQYSKINPDWVYAFIADHKPFMAKLTIKEASKYLPKIKP